MHKTLDPLLLALALALGVTLAHGEAQAQQAPAPADTGPTGVLRLGKLYTFGGGADLQHGFGMDLRYELFPERDLDGFLGVFAQGQYETGDAWRFAGGATVGWGFFGLELGVSHRTATATYAGSTGLHVAQYFQIGPVAIGGRLAVPLLDHLPQNAAAMPSVQGVEGALTIRMSFGLTLHGPRRSQGCHAMHGGGGVRDPHAHH